MKRIFITGGSGGIGAACVEKFTSCNHAAVFTYHTNRSAAEALAKKTGAAAVFCDLTDTASVNAAVTFAKDILGKIDVLVNCAGIAEIKLFTELSEEDWTRMLSINLSSLFLTTKAVVPDMIASQSGKIVNIGSMWGKVGASCEVHYSAAKAGVEGFTKALAKELGPSHINVNCVEPGVIATPMNGMLDETARQSLIDETPLCRLGKPEDVAEAVYFLASDEASFITGQILGVDGGFAI